MAYPKRHGQLFFPNKSRACSSNPRPIEMVELTFNEENGTHSLENLKPHRFFLPEGRLTIFVGAAI